MKNSPLCTSTLTPLSRVQGKIGMNCDHCGLSFETYACWAKRKKNHYCGRPCADAAKVRRTKVNCIVCQKEFEVIPSYVGSVVTCSRVCLRHRRRELTLKQLENIESSSFFRFGIPLSGEEIGTAKLTASQVKAILLDDRVQQVIADEYGITQTLVSQIKQGKIWKSVTGRDKCRT